MPKKKKLYQFYVIAADRQGIGGTGYKQILVTASSWFEGLKMSRVSFNMDEFRDFKTRYWFLKSSFNHYIQSGQAGNFDIVTSLIEAMVEIYKSCCRVDCPKATELLIAAKTDKLIKEIIQKRG